MFRINEVLNYGGTLYRVLALAGSQLVWIDIDAPKALPSLVSIEDLETALEEEHLLRAEDPYAKLAFSTPAQGSTAQIKRDRNFKLIRAIVSDPHFYEPQVRGAKMKQSMNENGASRTNLYKLIRRYWQRGQTPNALLPNYRNSGGKGKKRRSNGNKLGRPRTISPGVGAIIDEQTERLFRIAISRHLHTEKKSSFPYAHRRFVTLFKNIFPETPDSEIPTIGQMHHFYKREYNLEEKLKKSTPKIKFNKDIRQLSSTATAHALGPGARYEIDATIADIYLLSGAEQIDIVGRPVVYFVIDVFSRMIAGLYIGFENPSYPAAIQALAMAMTDKVEFCAEYGQAITEEEWPAVGLPDAILADRGELLGHQIESLESSFSVRIENTPPYRGDAKGIVERYFRTVQADFKPFAPGVVTETTIQKRGGKDYRLDAKLTVWEFKKIIISSVLEHNRSHVLAKYDREPDMPPELEMTPISIWRWGIQNRTGRLRHAPEEALRISLLPKTKATISDLGISVFGVHYTCPELIERGWLHRAREVKRPVGLQAAYDPNSADTVYLFPSNNTAEYWTCNLTPRSREFAGTSFWDVWQIKLLQKKAIAQSRLHQGESKRKHEEDVAEILDTAKKRVIQDDERSSAERIRSIRLNKKREKAKERQEHKTGPTPKPQSKLGKAVPMREDDQLTNLDYPDYADILFDSEDE